MGLKYKTLQVKHAKNLRIIKFLT